MTAASATTDGGPIEPSATARLPGLIYRRFRDDRDFDRLAELATACNVFDGVPWVPTASHLRSELAERASVDIQLDLVLAEVGNQLVGTANVDRAVREGIPVYQVDGAVLPRFRRRGLGSALMDWSIRRANQRAAQEDPDGGALLQGDAEDQEIGHRALLADWEFEPVRHFFLMRRSALSDIPDVPLPDGLEVRPVEPEDLRRILDAEFEAFRDHWGNRERTEDSYRETLGRPELNADLWVVAWDRDEIAGVVENWIWTEENEQLGVERGWLERIGVRRPWRRRGLARALTAASLLRLGDAGMKEAMLGVDSENPNGALGLYEGLGFEIHSRAAAYRRPINGTD